jgi:hypothetical protein
MTDLSPARRHARHEHVHTSPRASRQMCLICTIVADLTEVAQADLQEGRLDEVAKRLVMIRAQITGERV